MDDLKSDEIVGEGSTAQELMVGMVGICDDHNLEDITVAIANLMAYVGTKVEMEDGEIVTWSRLITPAVEKCLAVQKEARGKLQ